MKIRQHLNTAFLQPCNAADRHMVKLRVFPFCNIYTQFNLFSLPWHLMCLVRHQSLDGLLTRIVFVRAFVEYARV